LTEKSISYRCGMVSIVGRPNVGKSTLLNTIVGEKVTIVSKVPQTTRHRIRGIYSDERGQIVFIDTPGLVSGKDRLDYLLRKVCLGATQDVDCIIHLVDTQETVGKEEVELVKRLNGVKVPIILGLNKIDLKGEYIPEYIALWEQVKNKPINHIDSLTMVALSGKDCINVDKLLDVLFEKLPEGEPFYPTDTISDIPQKILIADIIREKLLYVLREEVPHSIAVVIESIKPRRKKTLHIQAVILVERESQKEIVIGKKGHTLKTIGTQARQELEELVGSKIFLETYVKTQKKWRDDLQLLQELGYDI